MYDESDTMRMIGDVCIFDLIDDDMKSKLAEVIFIDKSGKAVMDGFTLGFIFGKKVGECSTRTF